MWDVSKTPNAAYLRGLAIENLDGYIEVKAAVVLAALIELAYQKPEGVDKTSSPAREAGLS